MSDADHLVHLHHLRGDHAPGTTKTWEVRHDGTLIGRLYRIGPADRPSSYRFDPATGSGLAPRVFDRQEDARAGLATDAAAAP